MNLHETIEQGEQKWLELYDLGTTIGRTAEIHSFLYQHTIDILEAVKGEVPKEKDQLDKNDPDNYGACYAISGFNDAVSRITSLIDVELTELRNK